MEGMSRVAPSVRGCHGCRGPPSRRIRQWCPPLFELRKTAACAIRPGQRLARGSTFRSALVVAFCYVVATGCVIFMSMYRVLGAPRAVLRAPCAMASSRALGEGRLDPERLEDLLANVREVGELVVDLRAAKRKMGPSRWRARHELSEKPSGRPSGAHGSLHAIAERAVISGASTSVPSTCPRARRGRRARARGCGP